MDQKEISHPFPPLKALKIRWKESAKIREKHRKAWEDICTFTYWLEDFPELRRKSVKIVKVTKGSERDAAFICGEREQKRIF